MKKGILFSLVIMAFLAVGCGKDCICDLRDKNDDNDTFIEGKRAVPPADLKLAEPSGK